MGRSTPNEHVEGVHVVTVALLHVAVARIAIQYVTKGGLHALGG
jgi:hypothetical protein